MPIAASSPEVVSRNTSAQPAAALGQEDAAARLVVEDEFGQGPGYVGLEAEAIACAVARVDDAVQRDDPPEVAGFELVPQLDGGGRRHRILASCGHAAARISPVPQL